MDRICKGGVSKARSLSDLKEAILVCRGTEGRYHNVAALHAIMIPSMK